MARYLAVGNVNREGTCDLRIFFSHPEVEFLNTGPDREVYGLQKRPARAILADVRRGRYDLVFAGNNAFPYFNPRKGALRNLANLAWKLARHPNLLTGRQFPYSRLESSLVGLDLQDSPIVRNSRFEVLRHSICYFKRELPPNPCNAFLYTSAKTEDNSNVLRSPIFQAWIRKLRPISLGIDADACRRLSSMQAAKKTDVFFAGNLENRPNRVSGLRQLERLKEEGYAVDLAPGRLPRDEFLLRCAQAHVVWSPEGFGWDCFRHYEIAMVGSAPLMQSPTICRYAPLMDGEHALYYYVEGDHLSARIRQALQNRAKLVEMGQAARRHVLTWHTHEALGRYIIQETQNTMAGGSS